MDCARASVRTWAVIAVHERMAHFSHSWGQTTTLPVHPGGSPVLVASLWDSVVVLQYRASPVAWGGALSNASLFTRAQARERLNFRSCEGPPISGRQRRLRT